MSGDRRTRVLHIFHRMDRGGAETWIVNAFRHIDREQLRFDFLLESELPGAYDEEIRALGGRLLHAGSPWNLPRFTRAFRRIAREHGPYDVIHSHVHHASGVMLALAASQGIPVRIAHSHSDIRPLQRNAPLPKRLYYWGTEVLIGRYATVGLAASRDAAVSLFGAGWERDPRYRVLHCGIDLASFEGPIDRAAMRSGLGIEPDAYVVGHVGRFTSVKNHAFLVDVFARVRAVRSDAILLLVGEGPLRGEIERKVEELGLTETVVFAGSRSDVPKILRGAIDCFVFPSMYEGLGLAVVEAQVAGLPCVVSDAVPAEATISPDLVQRLSLSEDVERWAVRILKQHGEASERGAHEAIERAIESPFNLQAGVHSLECVYLER